MTDTVKSPKPKWHWTRYLLVLSLGLNLLILGVMLGAVLRGGPGDRMRGHHDASVLGLRAYVRALAPDDRDSLMHQIAMNRPALRAGRATMSAHLAKLAAALKITPYDHDAVQAVLTDQAKAISRNVAEGQKLLMDQLDAMTDAQRKALAGRLSDQSH